MSVHKESISDCSEEKVCYNYQININCFINLKIINSRMRVTLKFAKDQNFFYKCIKETHIKQVLV